MVVPTVAVCVCRSSPPAPETNTVSVGAPTSNSILISDGLPMSILIPETSAFLNPGATMVAEYKPVATDGILKFPLSLVWVVNS